MAFLKLGEMNLWQFLPPRRRLTRIGGMSWNQEIKGENRIGSILTMACTVYNLLWSNNLPSIIHIFSGVPNPLLGRLECCIHIFVCSFVWWVSSYMPELAAVSLQTGFLCTKIPPCSLKSLSSLHYSHTPHHLLFFESYYIYRTCTHCSAFLTELFLCKSLIDLLWLKCLLL